MAATFVRWSGSIQEFWFENSRYAALFLAANARKAVNVSLEAQRLVAELAPDAAERPRKRSPGTRPAPAPRPDEAYLSWIGRIEGAKGPAKRRAIVEAALRDLSGGEYREKLLVEAARIEVHAALDKADGLETRAAKLRTLRSALDAVRADEIPDELQAREIYLLEQAIAETEAEAPS